MQMEKTVQTIPASRLEELSKVKELMVELVSSSSSSAKREAIKQEVRDRLKHLEKSNESAN